MATFINPYAFVSFKNVEDRKTIDDLLKEKTYSGSFEYTIELKTPLIIPNTSSDKFNIDNEVSKSYGIYSYEDLTNKNKQSNEYKPVIPGSEIRGCIRSVYEALTNSCYNFNKDNDLYFSERVDAKNSYKPGVLLYNELSGKWELYEANKYKIKGYRLDDENYNSKVNINNEQFYMFEKIYGSLKEEDDKNINGKNINKIYFENISKNKGEKEGYLTIGNKGLKEHTCVSVFIKKGPSLLTITKDDRNYKRLRESIKSFVDKDLNCTYQRYLNAINECKTITIYYDENIKGNFRFSPAQIGRILYNRSLYDLVEDSKYCTDKLLCPACLMFGNINENNSITGRVRFCDVILENYNYENSKYIDLISGSPKYSNKYFYAELKPENIQKDWDNIFSIAGRKFYWHHEPNINEIKNKVSQNDNSKLKSRYYYIDNNNLNKNDIKGKIYFNDLTKKEILMLYKTISLVDDNHCHKLGHGKPFGFGSCNFTVISLKSEGLNLDEIKNEVSWDDTLTNKELEYIFDFNALSKYKAQVNYPFIEDPNEEGFKWFVENKKTNKKQLPPLIEKNGRKPSSPVLRCRESQPVNNINNYNKKWK